MTDPVEMIARTIAQRFMPGPERDRYLLNGGCTPVEAARAVLADLEAAGWAVVPINPTEAMTKAFFEASAQARRTAKYGFPPTWTAALSARPR
jgi:hypothetical protein